MRLSVLYYRPFVQILSLSLRYSWSCKIHKITIQ